MKTKELLKRLAQLQKHKSYLKDFIQNAFDKLHELETEIALLIEELEKEKKR